MFFFGRTKERRPTTSSSIAAERRADDVGRHLQVLGLGPDASWDDVCLAHQRLVADLTPSDGASHRKVALAESFLAEVNQAFSSLRVMQPVA